MYAKLGAAELPIVPADVDALADLDPARDVLLDLFTAALRAELDTVWATYAAGTTLAGKQVVESSVPHPPTSEILRNAVYPFPALFVYRSEDPARVTERTLWQFQVAQRWGVDLILGPMTVGDQRKTLDILTAATRVLLAVIRAGGHSSYQSDAQVFGSGYAGFSTIGVENYRLGSARVSESDPAYHALSFVLETTELEGEVDGLDGPFDGVTILANETEGREPVG